MRFALPFAVMTALAAPAAALDLDAMTDAERNAFGENVRSYLMENPQVLMEVIAVLEQQQADAAAMTDQTLVQVNAEALFDDPNSWVGGNPEGDVTIVEFLDYRCGFCKRAHPAVNELVGSDGNIRVIVKEFPILGEQSVMASRFAVATRQIAGDDAYAAVSDALMAMRGEVSPASLGRLAEVLEIDYAEIETVMMSDDVTTILQANRALGDRMQITGTPTFVFGDQLVRGFVELPQMQGIVEELRASQG